MNIPVSSFIKASREMLRFLKECENFKDLMLKSIFINKDVTLIPCSKFMLDDPKIIQKLTKWRKENSHFYFDDMPPNVDSTEQWLKHEIIENPDRILFIILDKYNNYIGQIGISNKEFFKNTVEIDHLILDEVAEDLKSRNEIIDKLINWAENTINVEKIYIRIFSNQIDTINFYKDANFFEVKKIKNKDNLNINATEYKYFESAKGDVVLLEYKKNNFNLDKKILTAGPSISQKEIYYVNDAVTSGWNFNHSRYLEKFQKKFSEIIEVDYCIATSSCTGAMVIALMALDINKGDEVIIPDISWVATGRAVQMVGATPIYVDVSKNDWTIEFNEIEKAINKNTKAIMPVHLYGMPCNMTEITKIANKYNIKIIEDAAPAIGATHKRKFCGSFGDFGTFSFQGAKLAVTGEGGMLVTNNRKLYDRALKIWDFGRNVNKTFWIDNYGVKFKMSNVQAALGLGQIERLNEMIYMKRRIFSWYKKYLDSNKAKIIEENDDNYAIYWMTNVLINDEKINRESLMLELKKQNIDSRPVFPSVSEYPIWNNPEKISLTNSKTISSKGLNLPSGVLLTQSDIKRVCDSINRLL